jgi:elongation factor G
MGDLQTRRAIIMGMESEGHYQKILARVPLAELYQYSSTLRSLTQGKAKFSLRFSEYAPVPSEIQHKLIAEYQAELQEA